MLDGALPPSAGDPNAEASAPAASDRPSPWHHRRVDDVEPVTRVKLSGLISRGFGDFLAHCYPPVEYVMEPWLPARGLAMVAGFRGIGKTFVASTVAHAVATGGASLGFQVSTPRNVLYVDGEMDCPSSEFLRQWGS